MKYKLLKNVLSKETCEVLSDEIRLIRDVSQGTHEAWEDTGNSWHEYNIFATESLLKRFSPVMSEKFKKELDPTYSYCRIYYKGGYLAPHKDREACEYSMTLCLSKTINYPLFVEGIPIEMEIGDAVIYKGRELEHWREEYEGDEHIQVFLHWVDKNGEYKDFKFDKRKGIGCIRENNG